MSKSNILILLGTHYSTTPNVSKPGLILINSPKQHKECLIKPGENLILDLQKPQGCELLKKGKYLEVDNYLSEYDTKEKKAIIRKNLEIDGLALWGNIQGHIEDLLDLMEIIGDITDGEILDLENLVNDKVSKEIANGSSASEQIRYTVKNNDFGLNENYKEAVAELGEIQSVDDAIAVIMRSLFPVEYINWSFNVENTATKAYSFEKGSTLTVDGNDTIGTITITAVPGNRAELGDVVTEFKVNDLVIEGKTGKEEFTYIITVKARDILGTNLSHTTASTQNKDYNLSMKTEKVANSITYTTAATVLFSTQLYYFYLSSDTPIDATSFNGATIKPTSGDNLNFMSTSKISGVYSLGSEKKYLYLLSPREVDLVETSAATTWAGALNGTFSITTAWSKKQVTYTPIAGGTNQNYWLVTLDGQQSNYVKIKVTTK